MYMWDLGFLKKFYLKKLLDYIRICIYCKSITFSSGKTKVTNKLVFFPFL